MRVAGTLGLPPTAEAYMSQKEAITIVKRGCVWHKPWSSQGCQGRSWAPPQVCPIGVPHGESSTGSSSLLAWATKPHSCRRARFSEVAQAGFPSRQPLTLSARPASPGRFPAQEGRLARSASLGGSARLICAGNPRGSARARLPGPARHGPGCMARRGSARLGWRAAQLGSARHGLARLGPAGGEAQLGSTRHALGRLGAARLARDSDRLGPTDRFDRIGSLRRGSA